MLNGIFIRDAIIDFPFHNPMEWAKTYCRQYPAITLGFYPTGFSLTLGFLFLFTYATHAVAQMFMTFARLCHRPGCPAGCRDEMCITMSGGPGVRIHRISRIPAG